MATIEILVRDGQTKFDVNDANAVLDHAMRDLSDRGVLVLLGSTRRVAGGVTSLKMIVANEDVPKSDLEVLGTSVARRALQGSGTMSFDVVGRLS